MYSYTQLVPRSGCKSVDLTARVTGGLPRGTAVETENVFRAKKARKRNVATRPVHAIMGRFCKMFFELELGASNTHCIGWQVVLFLDMFSVPSKFDGLDFSKQFVAFDSRYTLATKTKPSLW